MSYSQSPRRKVSLYAASVVAPQAANLDEFLAVVNAGKPVLTPKESLSNAFLVGMPKFDFSVYKDWLEKRHGPKRYSLLNEKNSLFVKYAVGSFIDALSSHPELENVLKTIDTRLVIQYAHGLADLPTIHKSARDYDKGTFQWNAFWADPVRNPECAKYLSTGVASANPPANPKDFPVDSLERHEALQAWNTFWAKRSTLLQEYVVKLKEIEAGNVEGEDIETAKLAMIRAKLKARKELLEEYGCPLPPWESVPAHLLWNITNIPASQVSMLLGLHGASSGYAGACASFGAVLDNAMLEIQSGRVDIAIVGSVDAPPTDELVSAFYSGRLAGLGDEPSTPFCFMRGTHVSGGACTWIIAADDAMEKYGLKPLPIEILGTGVSSDAEHIITPSKEGPKLAVRRAFENAGISPSEIHLWDMHATGTPGDWNEFTLIQDIVPPSAYISARKGIFGHGMSVSGGWELTALLLGAQYTKNGTCILPPAAIPPKSLNSKIAALKRKLLLDKKVEIPAPQGGLLCGKLSMGLGGISSCVIARVTNP